MPSSVVCSIVRLAPGSTMTTAEPFAPPALLLIQLLRTITPFAAITSPPVIRSPSITVPSAVILRPGVDVSAPPGQPAAPGPAHPQAARFRHTWDGRQIVGGGDPPGGCAPGEAPIPTAAWPRMTIRDA